jgi:hypothetical protein
MLKKHLYLVDGGLGKNIIFTSILSQLYEKHKDTICIEASFPNVFYNNPYVASVFGKVTGNTLLNIGLKEHYQQYETINGNEPYLSNWLKRDIHLITSYQLLNNLEVKKVLPNLYWDLSLENKLINTLNKISPFIIVQFSGGELNQPNYSNIMRDYKRGQELIDKIKQLNPNINIIVFGHDNMDYQNVLKINFELTEQYFVLAKYCVTFISIDSALQHFASNQNINKKGIVLWGETSPINFGYEKNINLLSCTPHVVDIKTDIIIEKLKSII